MKSLYNLSIRKKFAVVIIPLIAIIIGFDYFQIRHNYHDYNDAIRLNEAIVVSIEINHVIHEIQKERGITSGFLANEGMSFQRELSAQRKVTDSTLQEFLFEMISPNLFDLMEVHADDLERVKNYFEKLPEIRDKVDRLAVTPDQAMMLYSDINSVALNKVNDLINETRDREVAQQVHAIIYFLKSKELASKERAVGAKAFSLNHIGYDMYNSYNTLVAEQEAYLDAFLTIANGESKAFFHKTVQGPEVNEVNRMREVLFRNENLQEDPNHWLEMITGKINSLKQVEDFMSTRIHAHTEAIAASAFRDFWLFLVLDLLIGIMAFWLMTVIVTNMLENVSKLEVFTRKISSGDLSKKIHLETRDELGQYAKTFNIMVEEINKSHQELKKQRDYANFLYKNIYQVSIVVFKNIQQGIFLLDKDFKISKLYSRATETIFDRHKIAGENFANFMRPLIIPRDLEALEMFMRHLFNPDMDEEVVNQLNPVEQVKIYTEKNGVVTPKYIRVSFTRIIRNERIRNIMVTISDETQSILLQQHLDESEKKKKQETEQVLSILKIDPAVMRGFIHNSKKTLLAISERYEKNGDNDYRALLDFTFKTVHNLKGNSVVIGLELMANKFHDIEDSITRLKDKKVRGKDFLTILYEIDEADKMMDDMAEMLRKVANIYKNLPSEGQIASNIMVVDALEKGVELISKQVGKSVSFTFRNDKNLVIPEHYLNAFKDSMIQLIRNSIAHGIEKPDVRKKLKKPVKGNIAIELDRNGEEILITYKDDGGGLEPEKIRERAVAKGLISEYEAAKMTEEQSINLIFKSGFSTSDEVDKYSGRGQGMNLVKSIIEEQDGSFIITFEKGQFFAMSIRLPIPNFDKQEKVAS